jgi:hypothetical protein
MRLELLIVARLVLFWGRQPVDLPLGYRTELMLPPLVGQGDQEEDQPVPGLTELGVRCIHLCHTEMMLIIELDWDAD